MKSADIRMIAEAVARARTAYTDDRDLAVLDVVTTKLADAIEADSVAEEAANRREMFCRLALAPPLFRTPR